MPSSMPTAAVWPSGLSAERVMAGRDLERPRLLAGLEIPPGLLGHLRAGQLVGLRVVEEEAGEEVRDRERLTVRAYRRPAQKIGLAVHDARHRGCA
jgi:hypothetical protein